VITWHYVFRRNDANGVVHTTHWWFRRDVKCGGTENARWPMSKQEVAHKLTRSSATLCPSCFPDGL
jgi:hypothetical protein